MYSLGKESGWPSLVAALLMDTQVFKLTVELTTLTTLYQGWCNLTFIQLMNSTSNKTLGGNKELLFHVLFHEKLTKKMSSMSRNASHSAAPLVWSLPF